MALAFVAVIAVSVAATVWFTHRGSGDQASGVGSPASGGAVASAGDTGPVGIITEDPTCERWVGLLSSSSAQLAAWGERDESIPATAWTPEQRQMYESAARVLRAEADQSVRLAKETPHRVTRELYEQLIAYRRAYADAIPEYTLGHDQLARVGNGLAGSLLHVCNAIANLSVANRATSITAAAEPSGIAPLSDPEQPKRFLTVPATVCPQLASQLESMEDSLSKWSKLPNVPSMQWSSADRLVWENAGGFLERSADRIEEIGRASSNSVMEDFLVLSAQYYRAYSKSIPTFAVPDAELYLAGQNVGVAVNAACRAVEG